MSMRRLVQIDDDGWCMEIDMVKLQRVATAFKDWLLTLDSKYDQFNFLEKDLPLVEAALNGTMTLPYKGLEPHAWEWHEELLPIEYREISAPFYNTIRGAERSIETITENGKRYAWVEFEYLPTDEKNA